MEYAEFEEKEFENPLYTQLLGDSRRIATPGQVFEHVFGADACLEALNASFWTAVGYPRPPLGARLNDFSWGWVWRVLGNKRRLPTFSVNLLIQAKRPDFLTGNNQRFAPFGVNRNYWRFRIRKHQQEALTRLSETLGNRALVIYASPAFHTLQDLYDYTEAGTLIQNSTFPDAEWLENHSTWNYTQAGRLGVAASKPQWFRDQDLEAIIAERISGTDELSAKEQFDILFRSVEKTASSLDPENPIGTRYLQLISSEAERQDELEESGGPLSPDAIRFQNCLLFFRLVGVEWFIAGRPQRFRFRKAQN